LSWTGSVAESRELLELAQEAGRVGIFEWDVRNGAESGSTRTLIPAQGGQQSGDCGQQVMAG
jgi:hypothetical protein